MADAPGNESSIPQTRNGWIGTIERAQEAQDMRAWATACDIIRKQYRYEESRQAKTRRYQMLWSNIEVLRGATYAKPPQAAVQRRWLDKDQTARQAALMVERCINFEFDYSDYDTKFRQVRDDYLLFARGVGRVVYRPIMEVVEPQPSDLEDGASQESVSREIEEAQENSPPQEILKFEHVEFKYVQRQDFAHAPARVWDEVTWVAFRSFLNRDELEDRFGDDLGKKIPLDATSKTDNHDGRNRADDEPKATVWEIWDRPNKRVLWVAVGWPDVLEESEPYLKLTGFFPCPRPAYGTLTNDSLAPRPDYVFYQDQAEEINTLTARIGALEESLKLVGFYPAGPEGEGAPEIERAVQPGVENKMIAVKAWAVWSDQGSKGPPIVWLPVEQVIKVLEGCVKLRQQLIDDVYQITGISDIVRGATDPNETKGAQVLKSQHAGLRMSARQGELARFCRDVSRLVGEIVCNHFQPETIMAMSNTPLPTDEQVLAQMQQQALQAAQAQAQQQAAQQAQPMMGAPA